MLGTCLQNVREKGPLVHNITNYVTVNDVANVILACGASPIMSDEPQDVLTALDEIKSKGKLAALAIKPKTPASVVLPYLDKLDMVLVMTVEPGFGGQSFMADMLPKIRGIRALIEQYRPGCEVEVDGGIDEKTAPLVVDAGANVLVAGSAVFGKSDRAAAIAGIRMAADVIA